MTRRLRLLVASFPLLTLCVAPAAHADPIAVTAGQFVVAWDDPSYFNISGTGFNVSGLFVRVTVSPQTVCFSGCSPGTVVDMSSTAGLQLGTSLSAMINGTQLVTPGDPTSFLELSGTFQFDGGSVVIPTQVPEFGPVTLSAPFSFHGDVAGYRRDNLNGEPAFRLDLVGQGTANLLLSRTPGGLLGAPEAVYAFAPADPVPEPTTILLCGSGLAMLVRRRRSRCCDRRQT